MEAIPSTSLPLISSSETGSISAGLIPKGRHVNPGLVGVTPASSAITCGPVSVWKYVYLLVSLFIMLLYYMKTDPLF